MRSEVKRTLLLLIRTTVFFLVLQTINIVFLQFLHLPWWIPILLSFGAAIPGWGLEGLMVGGRTTPDGRVHPHEWFLPMFLAQIAWACSFFLYIFYHFPYWITLVVFVATFFLVWGVRKLFSRIRNVRD